MVSEGTIPQEYRHLSGADLAEALEFEKVNDVKYLTKVRHNFLVENRLDIFKSLARRGAVSGARVCCAALH